MKKLFTFFAFFFTDLVFSEDINLICLDDNKNELSIIFNNELLEGGNTTITSSSYFKEYELYTLSGGVAYGGKNYIFTYYYNETSRFMRSEEERRQERAIQEILECSSNSDCSLEDKYNLYIEEVNKSLEIEQTIENEKLKQISVSLKIDRETLKLNGEIWRGEDESEDSKKIEASCSIKESSDYQI